MSRFKISIIISSCLHIALFLFLSVRSVQGTIPHSYIVVPLDITRISSLAHTKSVHQPIPHQNTVPPTVSNTIQPATNLTTASQMLSDEPATIPQDVSAAAPEDIRDTASTTITCADGNADAVSGSLSNILRLPSFRTQTKPVYPPNAKMNGIEADVLVEVIIDGTGKTRHVVVVKSGGEEFDKATMDAVCKSSFTPALSTEGKTISVTVRIPFKFELE